ncbi:ABC transporter substrate-binding protein [Microvirga roseola]|uniref:ABC transporter substrate-binding protein n=1 Tax=Microvirga roseola TaxID=2883126 RepID=UPI001E291147|nr:ABC transporter substrate-binding protein [Microvirga roseola]
MSKALKFVLIAGAAALTVGSMPAVAQQANTLTVLRVIDADKYDPIRSTATAAAEIVYMLADTLVSIDFDMKTIKPLLAKSWEVSEDGKTYTFKLREDVKFCDGRPMRAEDVVYSLKRWTDPASKSPVSFRGGPVKDIKAADDYTVVYEMKEPYADLLFQLGLSFASVVDKATVEQLGENFGVQGFNATGPYCWVRWTPRQDFVIKKNPHYTWGPEIYKDPKPQVEQIVWRVIPEQNTLMAAMQAKQADATYYMPYIALDTISRIPGMKVQQQKNYIYDAFMGFKVDKPVVKDEVIRRAVNMATNKDAIAKAVYFGKGAPMQSLLNPTVLDFDAQSASLMPKFNPAAAAKLLDEAGWKVGSDGVREKDGQKATFTVYGLRNAVNPRISEAMQADLRKIGIDMKIQLWDATVGWGKLATQEFDAFYMSYPYVTANEALNLYFRSTQTPTPNRMNWKNEKTDQLLATATTATDDTTRKGANAAVQQQLTEASVWVPLVSEPMWLVTGERVEGARPHGVYGAGLYKGLDIKLKR